MHSWQGYILLEWRLLVRSRMTQVLFILTILYAYVIHNAVSWTANFVYFLAQFSFLFLGPISIIALLFGIHVTRSDKLEGVDAILGSLPIRAYQQYLTKYFFAALPFLMVSFVPAFLYVWHVSRNSLIYRPWDFLFLLSNAIPFLYVISIGFFLGTLIKGKVCYFVGICFWFIHFYGGLLFLEPLLPSKFSLLPNFLLFDFQTMGFFDFLFGFNSNDSTFWLHRLFYTAAAISFVLFMIHILVKRRKEQGKWLWIAFSMIITLVGISAATTHVAVRADRETAYHSMLDREKDIFLNDLQSKSADVESYILNVNVQERGLLQFEAKMAVPFTTTTFPENIMTFTLNQALNIEKVMVSGEEYSFQRRGEILEINLMQVQATADYLDIEVIYSGHVNDYRKHYYRGIHNSNRNIFPFYVANKNQMNLPSYWGWYPLLGDVKLKNFELVNGKMVVYDNMPLHGNADFQIRINYPQSMPLYSNLDLKQQKSLGDSRLEAVFIGENVEGSTLLGGAIQQITREKDHLGVRILVNELVNEAYAGKIADLFLAAKILMNLLDEGILDSATTTTIIPIDQMKASRPIYNAGYLPVNTYLIDGLFTDSEAVMKTLESLDVYYQYLPKGVNENVKEIFYATCAAYIFRSNFNKPFDFSVLNHDGESRKEVVTRIQNDINQLPDDKILERIIKMWTMLPDSGNIEADFLAILSNED
ncbi:hypothetical protein ACFSTH_03265 [Paenibacillus yanchengensis]|uniref:M1 family peptidase n=1 Tax=Paenibacillus yanchengensis TaxID=2035833 RepID=A0ABW4YFX1_9BACL